MAGRPRAQRQRSGRTSRDDSRAKMGRTCRKRNAPTCGCAARKRALTRPAHVCARGAGSARGGAHSGARWCVPDDASVPALPLGVALRRVLKHRVHEVLVVHPRHRLPALVQRAVLGQRDDVLDVLADGLGLHTRAGARTRGRVRAMHAMWSASSQSGAPRCSVPPASSRAGLALPSAQGAPERALDPGATTAV